MLYTIAVVLLILWLLGLVTSYTMAGFIHILLVVVTVMVLVNLISGRRALWRFEGAWRGDASAATTQKRRWPEFDCNEQCFGLNVRVWGTTIAHRG